MSLPSASVSHTFKVGQQVAYVCIGQDPTYTSVERPEFTVHTGTVTSAGKKQFRLDGGKPSEISHFAGRTVLAGDEAGVERIIKGLAEGMRQKYENYARADVWKAAVKVPQERLDHYSKVATQYASGDYTVIRK